MVGSVLTSHNGFGGLFLRAIRTFFGTPASMTTAGTTSARIQAPFFRPNFRHFHAASIDITPRRAGLSKAEAEDMLDWLEAHGQTGRVSFVPGEGFTVS
jgi:hypothetical protein